MSRPPLFHRLVAWISRRCLRWFYREQAVIGRERIPAHGPVLLIGNHPNDLPDVLLGYATTARPLRYVATISAATNPVARWVYRGLGVVPVARARDVRKMKALGLDITTMNREAAAALHQALASGDAVGVFPEGGVADIPEIGVLRTGVARMVLDAFEAGAIDDLTIVPFGVQYEAPRTWGSDVVVAVGEPWSLAAWRDARRAEGQLPNAVALAERMRASLRSVTRNSPTWDAAEWRDLAMAAQAAATAAPGTLRAVQVALAQRDWPLPADDAETVNAEAVNAETVNAATPDAETPDAETPDVETPNARHVPPQAQEAAREQAVDRAPDLPAPLVRHQAARVARAGGIPTSARDHARVRHATGLPADADVPPWWRIVVWTPVALAGWFVHAPLFRLVAVLADRGKTCRTDHVIRRFVPGVYVVVAWYLLVGFALLVAADTADMEPLWALPLFLSLPRLGDTAVTWRHWLRARWLIRRARALKDGAADGVVPVR